MLQIKFTNIFSEIVYQGGELLQYQTIGSSGFDIRAVSILIPNSNEFYVLKNPKFTNEISTNVIDSYVLKPYERVCVQVGISISIPIEYEIQIRSRSGLAFKNGISVLNSPGTVDADYRGEIGATLINNSDTNFEIKSGDRIAQAVICRVEKLKIEFVKDLDMTQRGSGGFGSTGTL